MKNVTTFGSCPTQPSKRVFSKMMVKRGLVLIAVRLLLYTWNRNSCQLKIDYGTLTLLFQDSVGGLEVKNPHTGEFVPATPIVSNCDYFIDVYWSISRQPGTIVVNVGDLLARWSNDVLRSTLHRVVAPAEKISETESLTPARQSIAFFCNPNFSAEVSCLPNCGDVAKYPPVNTEDYIVGRLAVTYSWAPHH